ncbi:MAG: hypothetical protein NC081_05185 [Roseburia sp.]|nr:hypothetical protein [Roseburia sp.]
MKKHWLMISVVFYMAMLVLTFTARSIHERNLPQVTAEYLGEALIPMEYVDENGETQTGTTSRMVISRELTQQPVFVLYKDIKNGEERDFVREVQLVTGVEREDLLEVVSGIGFRDRVVVSSTGELVDGAEVTVTRTK